MSSSSGQIASPAHILVVDDNPATLYSTTRVLQSAGWRISQAETGEQALEKARQGVDLVVLDVNLPDIDGFEVCKRLREDETTARLPVLHLSATFVQDVHKVHGLESGADGYLTHPIEPPVLIATVNAFLRARQAEIDLRQVEDRFRAIFDNAPNGVAVIDDELTFVNVNPALCRMLQTQRGQVIGRKTLEFIPPDRQAEVPELDSRFHDKKTWRGVFPLIRGDGKVLDLEWSVSALSKPGLRLAIVSDISDRLRFEREREELLNSERSARTEAENANRLKDDFLATLSHELRTPLNAIVGWSQLLRMGQLAPDEMEEGLDAIERNARAQAKMIADLLDVSRITSGKIRLEIQQLDPAELIDEALTAVSPAAEAKSIAVTKELDVQVGPIAGDPSRLQQVIWNLVNNSVKFTPKEGRVHVTLRRTNSQVEIRVSDNGKGIGAALLPTIFERFSQGDASSTREHGGLGLGLAIAKQLVEMHGGTIAAESRGEGHGATFIVRLPVTPLQPDRSQTSTGPIAVQKSATDAVRGELGFASATDAQDVDLTGVRVLLVEDDSDSRRLLKRLIAGCGAETIESASAQEALAAIPKFRPHVLISDVGMPGQDGLALMKHLRSDGHTHDALPAIALTAFARDEDRQKALAAGFQMHLAKPVNPQELTRSIASLVGRS